MRKPSVAIGFIAAALTAAGCGGGGEGPGEPLVSTSLAGVYKGQPFVPAFGFATLYEGSNVIAMGDGPLNCASVHRPDPPSGTNGLFRLSTLEAGTYSSILVQLIQNHGDYEGVGSNGGTITITAVSDASVAGRISYNYTNDENQTFGLSGDFEVARCP